MALTSMKNILINPRKIALFMLLFISNFNLFRSQETQNPDCSKAKTCFQCFGIHSSKCQLASADGPCINAEDKEKSIIDIHSFCQDSNFTESNEIEDCGTDTIIDESKEFTPQIGATSGASGNKLPGLVCRYTYTPKYDVTDIIVRQNMNYVNNNDFELMVQYKFIEGNEIRNKKFLEEYDEFKLKNISELSFYYRATSEISEIPFSIIIDPDCFGCYNGECGIGLDPYDASTPINDIYDSCIETRAAQSKVSKYCGNPYILEATEYRIGPHDDDLFFKKGIVCRYTYTIPKGFSKHLSHPTLGVTTEYEVNVKGGADGDGNKFIEMLEIMVQTESYGVKNTTMVSGESKKGTVTGSYEINVYIRAKEDIFDDPKITLFASSTSEKKPEVEAILANRKNQDSGNGFTDKVKGFVSDLFGKNFKSKGMYVLIGLAAAVILLIILCKCCGKKKNKSMTRQEIDLEFNGGAKAKPKKNKTYDPYGYQSDEHRLNKNYQNKNKKQAVTTKKVKVVRKKKSKYSEGTDINSDF